MTILCGTLAEAPALAARLGPERWYRLLQTVVGLTQEVLHHYAGTLTLTTNDGFTAVFGAPVAQEDHARRAVLVAGGSLSLGMGLHSGLVVAGWLGQDPQRLATAVGASFHIATRLQQQATPGMILLSASTYQLVYAEVRATPCGTLAIDGQPIPMSMYAVQEHLRRDTGVAGRGSRALSPFVGRERKLALLQDHLAAAVAGQGQVLGLVGEPGMGKTRLLTEFYRTVPEDQVTVYEGRCLSYGQSIPYLPVRDFVRQVCELAEGDEPAAHMVAVRQRLHVSGITAEDDVVLILQLLDLPGASEDLAGLSHEDKQVWTFALLRHLVLNTAQRQPLVLVVENLHWSDPTSDAWLASLVERLPGAAVLLLGTYRPGYQPAWGTKAAVTQVALALLAEPDSRAVVQAVLGTVPLPETRLQTLMMRAGGNPFFLEELAWHAVEQAGVDTPEAIPETVHAVLAARIDWLPPEAKQLLQIAAVMGPEVPFALLQAMADMPEATLRHGLAHLQAAAFLYETCLLPEQVYTFKHALTQEVAYSSLLQERRRGLHARLVEALEALSSEWVAAQVERLAYHAMRGEVWDKAVTYCQQAGAKAGDRAAFREAVTACEQGLQALAHLPEDGDITALAIELRLTLGFHLTELGEHRRHRTLLGEAEALARRLNDRVRLGQVLTRMALVLNALGDLAPALTTGEQALALATALSDRAVEREAAARLRQILLCLGDFTRAVALLRRNVEAVDREGGTSSTRWRILSQAYLAWTLSELGAFPEGRRNGEEALRLATREGRGTSRLVAHGYLGHLYLTQGALAHAVRVLDQGLALCRAVGNQTTLRITTADLGVAYVLQGRLAEGRTLLEEALSVARRTGALGRAAGWATWLSEVCRLEGRGEEAWQHVYQALALARQQQARGDEARALHQLGVVLTHAAPPDAAQAEAYYQQAMTLADALGMRPLQAHCHRGLGTLYATIGQRQQARAALSTAIDLYRAMAMTFWLPQAEAVLAQVA